MWSWRFGPKFADHGYVVEQKFAIATSLACTECTNLLGVNGMIPVLKQPYTHQPT